MARWWTRWLSCDDFARTGLWDRADCCQSCHADEACWLDERILDGEAVAVWACTCSGREDPTDEDIRTALIAQPPNS